MKKYIIAAILLIPIAAFGWGIGLIGGGGGDAGGCPASPAVCKDDANLIALYLFELSGADIGDDYTTNYDLTSGSLPTRASNSAPEGSYVGSFAAASSQYLAKASAMDLTGDYSISFWVYIDSDSQNNPIFQNGTDHQHGNTVAFSWSVDDHYINFANRNNWVEKKAYMSTALDLTTWYHICLVYDAAAGDDMFTYLNGSTDGNTDGDLSAGSAGANVTIGYETLENKYFDGDLDEFAVFSRALSAAECNDIYTNGIRNP